MEYIEDIMLSGKLEPSSVIRVKKAMEKYGNNKWWRSADPYERAFFQIHEDVLMVSYTQFVDDIILLIGRSLQLPLELLSQSVKDEADARWKEYLEGGKRALLPLDEKIAEQKITKQGQVSHHSGSMTHKKDPTIEAMLKVGIFKRVDEDKIRCSKEFVHIFAYYMDHIKRKSDEDFKDYVTGMLVVSVLEFYPKGLKQKQLILRVTALLGFLDDVK